MSDTEKKTVRLTIDGRSVDAEVGKTILEVAQENGIDVPSLCYHPGLESFGACRLCVVEITRPDWDGWKKLVTSCLYPVEEELIVDTRSAEVKDNRKVVLDLLLARVPDSDVIRQLAAQHGIHDTTYSKRENADTCIMCTICVRVCDAIGCSAIATLSRGPDKYVDVPDKDACIGCLACALSCPTDAIPFEEIGGKRIIWDREFDLVKCATTGEYIGTQEQIDHFSKTSGLDKSYFEKSDKARKRETAAAFARVQF